MRIRVSPLSVSTSLCVIYAVIALIGLLSDTESAQFKFYVLTHGWIHEYLKNIEFLWSWGTHDYKAEMLAMAGFIVLPSSILFPITLLVTYLIARIIKKTNKVT